MVMVTDFSPLMTVANFIAGDYMTALMGEYLLENIPTPKLCMMCGHPGPLPIGYGGRWHTAH